MKVGFIGAGKMGGGMARRLSAGGHAVTVYDPSAAAVEACVAAGASAATSAQEAAGAAEAVFTSLPLPEHVLATYRELELGPDTICIDVSTIDPTTARAVADLLPGRFVACPVGKTPAQAEAGELPLFIGGDPAAIDTVRPLLSCIGANMYELGTVEAATTFKLVSNLIGMTNVAVLAEGLALAQNVGIPADTFTAALHDTGAWSFQCELRLPWMLAGDHAARFSVDLAAKDLRLALDAAARAGVPTPVGAQGLIQLVSASAHGYGGEDVTAVAKLIRPPVEG
ncbi:MAG TPA: NAD(P)-dependent oxidoreductase [Mycobacteriales bacterium]|nr:NAD(P)-dependent oxidoreductase [Mycobacteriales bacterium]